MSVVRRLTELVRPCLRSLEGSEQGVVVAISGGPDSVALARLLVLVRNSADPFPLVLAHLNHQLRGEESDRDEEFVKALHAGLTGAGVQSLDLCRERIDVRLGARARRENLEATARVVRYRWLAEVTRARGLRWVATGHTANDQAETVLHRLLRGTGLQGLRGIALQRQLEPGVHVVRPLLKVTREEVCACLAELDQEARQDQSNDDLSLTRNRIRHELLPHLAGHYNPQVVRQLARLAEQAEEAFCESEAMAAEFLRRAELPRAGALLVFDREKLAAASRSLVRAAFRLAWAREGWPTGAMSYEAWERLAGLVFDEVQAVDLPGKVHAHRRGRVVQLGRKTEAVL